MKSGEFGRITLIAIAVAALSACATDEANQSTTATPVSSASGTRAPGSSANASAARQPGAAYGKSAGSAALSAPDTHTVYYDFDKYDLKPEFRSVVEANAKYLNANTRQSVTIEGNCDERGSREYNLALGQRRADAVKSMLKLLGVSESRMETVSYGEEKPAAQGHDDTAWSKNRRSEIVYKGK